MTKIPYKINLSEDELPKYWQNIRPYMQEAPDPFINPVTFKPCTADDLRPVFCDELIEQELDNTNKFIEIPEEIRDFYKMYRPSPLTRAYNLEKALGTPAEIYYKFEGTNTSGSHKLNSAVAQVYYAKQQGLTHLTTETGAGQWGLLFRWPAVILALIFPYIWLRFQPSKNLIARPLWKLMVPELFLHLRILLK